MKPRYLIAIALVAASMLLPEIAIAQVAAGTGGFLGGFTGWVQSAVVAALSLIAVIFLGFILMAMRMSPLHAVQIAAGIWIAFNAAQLVGLFHT